ncbi:o-succinylbenzoate synthase [Caldinitratiruptor microaerophilus]|uniref:o-succinylbenzoate synthase n=1 Tax=Caldinitratiruptor microaerophilus TaxID=671077 RepID=A0AA35CLL5_9FIRM|nr:o-succinylbenzoate synthase [Caldinitratiruptor microaerophilus]BDG59530.1 o-succinylbenzoate synthase [Caldinitratiruptor microaerophilus]
MRVEQVRLRQVRMPLKSYFETSFGRQYDREFLIVEVRGEGLRGYGEVSTMAAPLYNEETTASAWVILEQNFIPQVLGRDFPHPHDLAAALQHFRRNHMAKAGLENAFWDLYARAQGQPLWAVLGGDPARKAVPVGISLGIQEHPETLLDQIAQALQRGYRRIKVKIRPGWDEPIIAAIRERFGDIPLMADANSAFTLADLDLLRRLDRHGLMMIEQPLAHDDIVDHARVQAELSTPICLDESIHSPEDARRALDLGSCRIINVKVGRVGGLSAVQALDRLARQRGVPLWCGGMLESGIGRAINLHLTTLPGFTLPGDTSPSDRYWERDIVSPPFTLNADGTITVPTGTGIGVDIDEEALDHYTVTAKDFAA